MRVVTRKLTTDGTRSPVAVVDCHSSKGENLLSINNDNMQHRSESKRLLTPNVLSSFSNVAGARAEEQERMKRKGGGEARG